MIKKVLIATIILTAGAIVFDSANTAHSNTSGGPTGYAGAPLESGRTCGSGGGCHTGTAVTTQTDLITSDIPVTGYIPGTTYNITATITGTSSKFGFQVTPQNPSKVNVGTLVNTSAQTKIVGSTVKYITQTSSGTAGTNTKTWTFQWTAPNPGTGDFTFYGTFNITNSNSSDSGDKIVKSTTAIIQDPTTGIETNQKQAIANFKVYPNPVQDFINFESSTILERINIQFYSLDGKLVLNEINFEDYKLNVESLAKGQYILRITSDNISVTKKIIKL